MSDISIKEKIMTKKYYKVVSKDLKSFMISSYCKEETHLGISIHYAEKAQFDDYLIQYQEQCWIGVKVPETKLMVFDTLQNAYEFKEKILRMHGHDGLIYECKVINPSKIGLTIVLSYTASFFFSQLNRLVSLKKKNKKYRHLCSSPQRGTIFVDAVKLIKRVPDAIGQNQI